MSSNKARERSPISKERQAETQRYGRDVFFEKLNGLLSDKEREAFQLVNVAIADLDDVIDESGKHDLIPEAIAILTNAFKGNLIAEPGDGWQKDIERLGTLLKDLEQGGSPVAKKIYEETVEFWIADSRDKERRGVISNQAMLDELNTDIGRAIAVQFLLFFCPMLSGEDLDTLARAYGHAVKTADNLSDLQKDLHKGFINISRESLEQFALRVEKNNDEFTLRGDVHSYEVVELKRAERLYENAQQYLDEVKKRYPDYQVALSLLRDVFVSWIEEARASSRP